MTKADRVPVLDSQKILEFDFTYFTRNGIEFDPYTLIFERGGELIRIARSMRRKYANQYRKFDVGSTSISVNPRTSRAASFLGACWKPTPKVDKFCAEMQSVTNARKDGYTQTVGMFVAATTDREAIRKVTGFATPTCYPCAACSDIFIEDATVVVSAGGDHEENIYELHTGADLKHLHEQPKSYVPRSLLIHDPELAVFGVARAAYLDITAGLRGLTEPEVRMERANAVIQAFREAA